MTDMDKVIEEAREAVMPFENWERLAGETSSAYAAFCAYRDLGPGRSIRKAVEGQIRKAGLPTEFPHVAKTPRDNLDAITAKKYRVWRNWSTQFRWRERAADYDRYLDRMKQTELRKTIEAQGEAQRAVTGKMLAVVSKKLDTMNPADLSQSNVTEWVETAIRAEREAAGLASSTSSGAGQRRLVQGEINFTSEFEGL